METNIPFAIYISLQSALKIIFLCAVAEERKHIGTLSIGAPVSRDAPNWNVLSFANFTINMLSRSYIEKSTIFNIRLIIH